MKVNYGAYAPLSTIDDYGHASIVIFLRGCELGCWYCHNKHLQTGEMLVDIADIKALIKNSAPYISSVTFSGGEPLLQLDALKELIPYAKSLNLEVCLFTSGNNPEELKEIMYQIDRIYLDLKLESSGIKNYTKYLKNAFISIKYLEDSNIYTIITMVVFNNKKETLDEIKDIKHFLGEREYVMIQGIVDNHKPLTPEEMKETFKHSFIRTKENGVEWNG